MMWTLRAAMSRRRPLTKLMLLGVAVVVCAACFVFVNVLNMESSETIEDTAHVRASHRRYGPESVGASARDRVLSYLNGSDKEAVHVDEYDNPLRVPRVKEYCYIPSKVVLGEDGEAPEGFVLTSVYTVIRHGDRTPMHSVLNVQHLSPPGGCTMDADFLNTIPELRNFLGDMAVQKDQQPPRSKFSSWSLYPRNTVCSNSQLTGQGAVQQLFNGLAMKEKYVKKWNLFGPQFSPSQLDIRSTPISRTYQSVVSLLYGFLPQFNVSEVDILPSENIYFCNPSMVPGVCCERSMRLKKLQDDARAAGRQRNPDLTDLAEVLDIKAGRLPPLAVLVDLFQGYACHGMKLPCGKGGKCVTASMLEKLWALVDSEGLAASRNTKFDQYSRALAHSLLAEILTNMLKVSRNQSPVRFTVYSGHDLTMTALLQTLGIYKGKWPSYATRLTFELYRKLRAKGEHYVRVIHNGQEITSLVRFCHRRTVEGMCALNHFKNFIYVENLKAIGVRDRLGLDSFCRS